MPGVCASQLCAGRCSAPCSAPWRPPGPAHPAAAPFAPSTSIQECDPGTVLKHLDNDAPALQVRARSWVTPCILARGPPCRQPLSSTRFPAFATRRPSASGLGTAGGAARPGSQRAVGQEERGLQLRSVPGEQPLRLAHLAQLPARQSGGRLHAVSASSRRRRRRRHQPLIPVERPTQVTPARPRMS